MEIKNLVKNARFEGDASSGVLNISLNPYPEVEVAFHSRDPDISPCKVFLETTETSGAMIMDSCCSKISCKPLEGAEIKRELFALTEGDGAVRVQVSGTLAYEGTHKGADRRLGSKPHGRWVLHARKCIIFTIDTRVGT